MDFDTALLTAAFRLAGEQGWQNVTVASAAIAAGLSLSEARRRFPSGAAVPMRFGQLVDQAALQGAPSEGLVRDRLFDLLMRRFDALQAHREGVKALLRALPTDPSLAMLLAAANTRSMRWMLQGAGVPATGLRGELQVRGLLVVWLWAVRAWEKDETEDLSGTMATLDTALHRVDRLASWLDGNRSAPPPGAQGTAQGATQGAAQGAGELDPSNAPRTNEPPLPLADL